MKKAFILGTRGSPLALYQSEFVKESLEAHFPSITFSLKKITTKGDKIKDVGLARIGGKGLFTKEIEDALLAQKIDLAVHSLKDLPTILPEGLKIGAIPKREDPRDALIGPKGLTLQGLPNGSIVGTSSLRRTAQLLSLRPDLKFVELRGNLHTRLRKLDRGDADALVLAMAGLKRLNLEERVCQVFSPGELLTAVGQGCLAVEIRKGDEEVEEVVRAIHHSPSAHCVEAERAFLKAMGGGCQVPMAALAQTSKGQLIIWALIASLDGKQVIRSSASGPRERAVKIGLEAATKLLGSGARAILRSLSLEEEGAVNHP